MRRGQSGINCLLAIDKPVGMSSHDVVNRVRRALGERRVGHAGTLDPAASGVLVVGVGQGTRLMGMLTQDSKAYEARIAFGRETDTDDAEGSVVREAAPPERASDAGYASGVLSSLEGEVDQVPPAYSAISVGGRRSYQRARSGEKVELPARRVTIESARLLGVEDGGRVWHCRFDVSKGTYIRSIARDLGRSLGSAAHLCGLRRVSSGTVGIERCVTIDEIEASGREGVTSHMLDPVSALDLPVRPIDEDEYADAMCGKPLSSLGLVLDEGQRVALVHRGSVVGVWHLEGGRLRCDANFPDGISGVGR
ncbi:MAG: tRNA pseudouridine(55) synthase TruB [Olsenella sp.]|nr:tRNA pseudouridine(55) synthase TruB [Olsenella sp.]